MKFNPRVAQIGNHDGVNAVDTISVMPDFHFSSSHPVSAGR